MLFYEEMLKRLDMQYFHSREIPSKAIQICKLNLHKIKTIYLWLS